MRELSRFTESLKRNLDTIESSITRPLSNAFVRKTNSKLKMVTHTIITAVAKLY